MKEKKSTRKQIFFSCDERIINKIDKYYNGFFDKDRYKKSQFIEDLISVGIRGFEIKLNQLLNEHNQKDNKEQN